MSKENASVPELKSLRHVETIDLKMGINGEIQEIKSLKDEVDSKKTIETLPLFTEILDSNTPFPEVSFFTIPSNISEKDFLPIEATTSNPIGNQSSENAKLQEGTTENKNVEKPVEQSIEDNLMLSDIIQDEKKEQKDTQKSLNEMFRETKTITEEEGGSSLPTMEKMIKEDNSSPELAKKIECVPDKKEEKLKEEIPKVQPIINPPPTEIKPVEIKEEPINQEISDNKKEIKPIIQEEIKPQNIINKILPKEEKKENPQILPTLEDQITKKPVSPKKEKKKIPEEEEKKETLEDLVKNRREKIADIKKSGKLPFSGTNDEIQNKIDVNSNSEALRRLRKDNNERAPTSGERACNCCFVF